MKLVITEGNRTSMMPEGPSIEKDVLGKDVSVEWYAQIDKKDYAETLSEADAIITTPWAPLSSEMIRHAKKLKVIVALGIGFDYIDIQAASKSGIPVCNIPDYGIEDVADNTVGMILEHHRKIRKFQFSEKLISDWDWKGQQPIIRPNKVKVGIIGLGRIGTAVALRLKGFNYQIQFYDSSLERGIEKSLGIGRVHNLDELIRDSDIITVHVPLTEQTENMIGAEFYSSLKPNAILINTARGGLFTSLDDMHLALQNLPELRIGTDVLPIEPPVKHPLLSSWKNHDAWLGDRLTITSHSSFYSESSIINLRKFAAQIVDSSLKNNTPYNVVNGVNHNDK